MPSNAKKQAKKNPAALARDAGIALVRAHPIFERMLWYGMVFAQDDTLCPQDGWAVVTRSARIYLHPKRRAEPEEWAYVIAHCLLHLGMGHFRRDETSVFGREDWQAWNAACDVFVTRFLDALKLGKRPEGFGTANEIGGQDEERMFRRFSAEGIPPEALSLGTAGHAPDMIWSDDAYNPQRSGDFELAFAEGVAAAVTAAVNMAGGAQKSLTDSSSPRTAAQLARSWFMSSFPLLGALAASFKIIEDKAICTRMDISIAAVDAQAREIYINPNAQLSMEEMRFVMAHELLHVGLRHQARCLGRDAYLWNVACDYVINGWLIEMRIGQMPRIGALHDPALKGESAEVIYDRIANDMRTYRKLATLRGIGVGDMLGGRIGDWWRLGDGVTLDEFYRRCMAQGLVMQCEYGRGFLPAGLIEEINALAMPPIPWDVALAKWFDMHFEPLEKRRSFARLSRRQSSTPDIPRPAAIVDQQELEGRTFGVVLDTSGSMARHLLAKALGTIDSYSMTHDVTAVRVVFCDAAAYDAGYMSPEAIAQSVDVRGRGGTVLQPGIDMLEQADDFPPDAPIMIITDGFFWERLLIKREHAYVLPSGRRLPYTPQGEVFWIE
jgi:predicted metal-dependent peptidase